MLLLLLVVVVAKLCPTVCDPMTCSTPAFSVHFAISWSLLKFMSVESEMLSNHLVLCRSLLLLRLIFPGIRVFSSELALHIRYPADGWLYKLETWAGDQG